MVLSSLLSDTTSIPDGSSFCDSFCALREEILTPDCAPALECCTFPFGVTRDEVKVPGNPGVPTS